MAEHQAGTKSRRLGSSRRKGFGEAPAAASSPGKEPPWAAEMVQRVQELLREQDKEQEGLITRSDIQKLREEDLPCSREELELVFNGLDAASTGRLKTEEFTFGLWQFLASQKAARDHRRRKTASRRVPLVLPSPALEVDSEEQRQFSAFMEQLGTDNSSEEHKAVAEQPSETPSSPQMSPEQSKKHHSEMQTRPGSQSSEPKAKSTHQVVWEVLPAEISILGSPQGASSVEEDPVPGSLKEERFSLLRDMDDATAALSKQLKPQAPGAPPAPANTAHQPQDDAEPQMGLEEATAHGTTPRVKQETLSGHVGHKLFEGDMEEGPGTTPDVPQADVWPLGASGQAAQSELQEQVSAQAEKSPHTMGTEKAAAGPAEVPKQEVPPASPLHTTVLQEEDAGNDQSGTVLGGSSLGDAASTQPQRQSLGEQSKDADQWKKKQEVARKMSQEGEPSPGNVAADGGSPKAPPDPDHLYNVLFVGDSHVGKTSFLYRLQANTFNPHLTTTVGLDYQVKTFVVDNKCFALRLWDSAGQERYHSITKQFFRKADGVVLMYDITSEYSFLDVQYWLSCIQEGAEDGVAILLLGNKSDCAAERQVPMEQGERLAKEHQLMFYECSAASGHNISESMVSLIRLLKVNEDKLKNKVEEVPKLPQKKKSCCW
ncbi:ras-related protein Rab-44 isoform X2 [Melopsittacus undulatus]|uniref:ras-related protein Rab-44 isoform X2 n=1 Tax=Melopsittacus undulatus TaxID=13146 RepID=UPI00146D2D8B|nr:ras-related protein Rab-44 isoform X2 [Melopsittacus undulatus]